MNPDDDLHVFANGLFPPAVLKGDPRVEPRGQESPHRHHDLPPEDGKDAGENQKGIEAVLKYYAK